MLSNVIALRAESVPGAPYPFHVADLATLPDGAWDYLVVEEKILYGQMLKNVTHHYSTPATNVLIS